MRHLFISGVLSGLQIYTAIAKANSTYPSARLVLATVLPTSIAIYKGALCNPHGNLLFKAMQVAA